MLREVQYLSGVYEFDIKEIFIIDIMTVGVSSMDTDKNDKEDDIGRRYERKGIDVNKH